MGAVLFLGLGGEEIKMTLLWFPGPAWTAFGSWLGAVLLAWRARGLGIDR